MIEIDEKLPVRNVLRLCLKCCFWPVNKYYSIQNLREWTSNLQWSHFIFPIRFQTFSKLKLPIMQARNRQSRPLEQRGQLVACVREQNTSWRGHYHPHDGKSLTVSFDSHNCSLFWFWIPRVAQDCPMLCDCTPRLIKFATQKTGVILCSPCQTLLHYIWLVRVSGKRGSTSDNPGWFPSEAGHPDRP
jgi:hypothetical protein